MRDALAIVELSSVSKGYEIADRMLKIADLDVIMCKSICPGKFLIALTGYVADVEMALNEVNHIEDKHVLSNFIITNPHEDIINSISKKYISKKISKAIGIVEHSSVAYSIKYLDCILKYCNVNLVKFVPGNLVGGKGYFIISSELSNVQEAVDYALKNIGRNKLINISVIPAPSEELLKSI
ncbi:BMC domain-containing protein [Hathewaya proteolytica DSM 3090]|uniref:BMC domain-containing protein n=1 Tax=Hathewaya proteolytica DSM 3090 TaxID=1121331 RepID=A0A1M6KCN3_9CLOT|nr:BMC domain-containing protein [Hathewaya proteolytica]SHJ56711.1 BMC domain-containing protein [Hathewaya proteolytica DSM 3090]